MSLADVLGLKVDRVSKTEYGFTLIEILIVLSILSIIITIIYGSFTNTYSVVKGLEERVDVEKPLWGTLEIMASDIRGAYYSDKDSSYLFKANRIEDVFDNPSLPLISFATFTPYSIEGTKRVSFVEYLLNKEDGHISILRRIRDGVAAGDAMTEVMVSGIKDMDITFRDEKLLYQSWDSSLSKRLPEGVLLDISFKDMSTELFIPVRGG